MICYIVGKVSATREATMLLLASQNDKVICPGRRFMV